MEYYWGDHIHLGFYTEAERQAGYKRKSFKGAKLDFVEEMLSFSRASGPQRILDVGCGIGGSSRHLAAKFPNAQVTGGHHPAQMLLQAMEQPCMQGLCSNSAKHLHPSVSWTWGAASGAPHATLPRSSQMPRSQVGTTSWQGDVQAAHAGCQP